MIFFLIRNKQQKTEDPTLAFKNEFNSFKDTFSQSFGSMSKDIAKDMSGALTRVDEKVGVFNKQVEALNKSQDNFSRILAGVKQYGVLAEFSLASLLKDLLPATQYIENVKMKPDETGDTVEFAIKHPTGLYLPVDAHWPKTLYEKLLELRKVETTDEAERQRLEKDKDKLFRDIMTDFAEKAEDVNEKYIDNPISAGFACIYVPSESLYHEITTHINQKKILWISTVQEKTKVTFMGPSTFSAYCSAILLGFKQIEGDQKAKMFIKHLDALTHSIDKLNEETVTHEKNVKKAYTDAQAVTSASEKMKSNMQRITEELDNMGKDEK